MVVKKSLFKGKILYWIILIICLSLFIIPKYYMVREPENFLHDEYSEYEGKPILNCNVKNSGPTDIKKAGEVYVKHNGNRCLVEKIPKESYFKTLHPTLYLLIFEWGNWIGIACILICLIPRGKKNEPKAKEGEIKKSD